jgi:hypothetical protein
MLHGIIPLLVYVWRKRASWVTVSCFHEHITLYNEWFTCIYETHRTRHKIHTNRKTNNSFFQPFFPPLDVMILAYNDLSFPSLLLTIRSFCATTYSPPPFPLHCCHIGKDTRNRNTTGRKDSESCIVDKERTKKKKKKKREKLRNSLRAIEEERKRVLQPMPYLLSQNLVYIHSFHCLYASSSFPHLLSYFFLSCKLHTWDLHRIY